MSTDLVGVARDSEDVAGAARVGSRVMSLRRRCRCKCCCRGLGESLAAFRHVRLSPEDVRRRSRDGLGSQRIRQLCSQSRCKARAADRDTGSRSSIALTGCSQLCHLRSRCVMLGAP